MIGIFGGGLLPLAAALGLGRAAWRGRAPHWTLELASGSALLSLLMFLLLAAHAAHGGLVIPLCGACAILLWIRRPAGEGTRAPLWMCAVVASYAVYDLVHALAPEIQPDAAGYHLGLVAEWARLHGMPGRAGFYEMLPLGLETLFYPAYLTGGTSAAKLVSFGYFLATIPLIFRIGLKLGLDLRASFAAAGLYFFTPVAAIAGSSAYTDAAAVFFPLAAFALLAEARGERPGVLFHAGLAAGFAYAVKMPGAVAAMGAAVWATVRDHRRGLALAGLGMLLAAGAWPVRNLILAGNPFAPLANRVFPNEHFHAFTEERLAHALTHYDGLRWFEAPVALAIDGTRLQGLVGPALFLLPLALPALRRPQGRALLLASIVLLLPWTRNLGARFLMPSLPFLFLAFSAWMRPRWMQALFAMQAAVCSPWALDAYADEHAWRLRGFPWKAALRMEAEPVYLRRELYEYGFVEKAAFLVGSDGLLDLYGVPFAYLKTVPLGPLPSARFDNALMALEKAMEAPREGIAVLRAATDARLIRGLRVRLEREWPGIWSIQEVWCERSGRRLPASGVWTADAWPDPGDAWLAIDANRATRWFTWDRTQPGVWWRVTFAAPQRLDAVIIRVPDAGLEPCISLEVLTADGRWNDLTSRLRKEGVERRVWRREAVRFVRSLGIRWIAAPVDRGGLAPLGRSLRALPHGWGLDPVLDEKGLALLRIRD